MLQDISDYDQAKAEIEKNGSEFIPAEIAYALVERANPIKTWREYRGIGQNDLAHRVGISVPYLLQLESSKRKGTLKVLAALAGELGLSVEDLLTE
jgi:DNA-binding XRE family transcriptional regulator